MRFTREQLQLLSDVLWSHQDEGPRGAGWASDPVSKLRAAVDVALAEPEPEGPTDEEIEEWADASAEVPLEALDPDVGGWQRCFNSTEFCQMVRAVLARWGNHPEFPDSSTQPH